MANEFQHKDPGATLTQAEYITTDGTGHIFDSQAQGDIVYASSSTVLSRLGKSGTTTHALLNSGTNNNPAWAQIPLASAVSGTLPVANGGTGITSLATGVATFLGTSSSANLRAALTDETGSGAAVFGTSPTLVTPALGTPASGVMTNVSGTAASLKAGSVTTNANLTGPVTSSGNATAIADKALAIAKLADGTDGELITWNASGVIAAVAVGSATQVLTSNGSGAAPTFQAAAGGPSQANQAALEAETNQDTYAAPDMIKFSPGVAKVWIKWESVGTHSILASYNMASITDGGAGGDTDHTFATDFSSIQYAFAGGPLDNGTTIYSVGLKDTTNAAGTMSTQIRGDTGATADLNDASMCIFGDQA
jgi:hypothetical protein